MLPGKNNTEEKGELRKRRYVTRHPAKLNGAAKQLKGLMYEYKNQNVKAFFQRWNQQIRPLEEEMDSEPKPNMKKQIHLLNI